MLSLQNISTIRDDSSKKFFFTPSKTFNFKNNSTSLLKIENRM